MKSLPNEIADDVQAILIGSARRSSPALRNTEPRLPVKIEMPGAKVMLLPGRYRNADYVRRHVDHVLSLDAAPGEAHVLQNLECIRSNLREIGVSDPEIDAEVRSIESAVRREVWRRVILGDPDDRA